MSFPLFPDKHKLPALLSADDMIAFRRKHALGDVAAPQSAIICLYNGLMRRFAWRHPAQRIKGFLGDVYLLKRTGGKVAVLGNFGIGAPGITSIADEMMAWGVQNIVDLSLAGGLQPGLPAGSIVVCERALRDEGTSYHYLPPSRTVDASAELVQALSKSLKERGLECTRGAVWSTDAPYRETREEAEQFASEGAKAVDMESAGIFAAAERRGRRAASVFVIGDSLAGPRWSAPVDMRLLHQRLKAVLGALIGAMSELE